AAAGSEKRHAPSARCTTRSFSACFWGVSDMARKKPSLGGTLGRLALYKARPVNRDARRLLEPMDSTRKKRAKRSSPPTWPARSEREGPQPPVTNPKTQVFKKDGTIVPARSKPEP